jgi:hypothetical protein
MAKHSDATLRRSKCRVEAGGHPLEVMLDQLLVRELDRSGKCPPPDVGGSQR